MAAESQLSLVEIGDDTILGARIGRRWPDEPEETTATSTFAETSSYYTLYLEHKV